MLGKKPSLEKNTRVRQRQKIMVSNSLKTKNNTFIICITISLSSQTSERMNNLSFISIERELLSKLRKDTSMFYQKVK